MDTIQQGPEPVVQQCECFGWNLFAKRSNEDETQENTKKHDLDADLGASVHDAEPLSKPLTQPINQTVLADSSGPSETVSDNWEDEYFKKFEWLMKGESLDEIKDHNNSPLELEKFIKMMEKHTSEERDHDDVPIDRSYAEDEFDDYLNNIKQETSFLKSLAVMLEPLVKIPTTPISANRPFTTAEKLDPKDPDKSALFLYFVSLKQNKMILHASVKKPEQMILDDCFAIYQYAQIYEPTRIVYTMQIQDLYDVDKYVKMCMNMFGLEDCRGGSYVGMELTETEKEMILREGETATIEHYVDQENALSK